MNTNLDELKAEIEKYVKSKGFILFYGYSRSIEHAMPEVEWDTVHYPDYKMFLDVAEKLGARMIVLHHRQFNAEIVDRAIDELPDAGFEYDDQRQFESRLRELRMYDGFTSAVELSFEHDETLYLFELRTEWYSELNRILDELDLGFDDEEDQDEGSSYGGYYSKN